MLQRQQRQKGSPRGHSTRSIYWTWLRMGEKNYISKVEPTLHFSIFCRFIKPHIDSVKVLSI